MESIARQHPEFLTVTCREWKHILADDRFKDLIIESLRFLTKELRIVVLSSSQSLPIGDSALRRIKLKNKPRPTNGMTGDLIDLLNKYKKSKNGNPDDERYRKNGY